MISSLLSDFQESFAWCAVLLYLLFIFLSLLWVLSDAEEKTGHGCAIALLVTLTWPFGLIIWLLLRSRWRDQIRNKE